MERTYDDCGCSVAVVALQVASARTISNTDSVLREAVRIGRVPTYGCIAWCNNSIVQRACTEINASSLRFLQKRRNRGKSKVSRTRQVEFSAARLLLRSICTYTHNIYEYSVQLCM